MRFWSVESACHESVQIKINLQDKLLQKSCETKINWTDELTFKKNKPVQKLYKHSHDGDNSNGKCVEGDSKLHAKGDEYSCKINVISVRLTERKAWN